MTRDEFKFAVIPFVELYWKKTVFMNFPQSTSQQLRLGKMVVFCRQSFVPDSVIILDNDEKIIDGFFVCGYDTWKGASIKDKLEELGVWEEEV